MKIFYFIRCQSTRWQTSLGGDRGVEQIRMTLVNWRIESGQNSKVTKLANEKFFLKSKRVRGCLRCTTHKKLQTKVFIEQHITTVGGNGRQKKQLEKNQIPQFLSTITSVLKKPGATGARQSWGLGQWPWASWARSAPEAPMNRIRSSQDFWL